MRGFEAPTLKNRTTPRRPAWFWFVLVGGFLVLSQLSIPPPLFCLFLVGACAGGKDTIE